MKDYWDEYKDKSLESSSDESNFNEPSLDLPNSDQEEDKVTWDYTKEAGTWKSLGNKRMAINRNWRIPFWANMKMWYRW